MGRIFVDTLGKKCPEPLVEFRKALKKASPGQVIEIIGDHPESKAEIIMACEESGNHVLDIHEEGKVWRIKVRKGQ